MRVKNIEFTVKHLPSMDNGYVPFGSFVEAYLKLAEKPIAVAVYRQDVEVSVHHTAIIGEKEYLEADKFYVERLVKSLLWIKGGATVHIYGDDDIAKHIKTEYSENGSREFDYEFMGGVYERTFSVEGFPLSEVPEAKENPYKAGGFLDGCRIGFDAGGSDRKVSAVIDGEVVYSEEVVWHPKLQSDPAYHFNGIMDALRSAASHMPRVDAIGISSAGIYINNRAMVASLFLKIPKERFDSEVKDIYIRACKEMGDVPYVVANDGDVTALAGSMSLDDSRILGIAMGTSQAVGYVNKDRNLTGWLNELAFMPVDISPTAALDEWSHDIGCGVKYFSQDAVIKLAPRAGIVLDENLSLAEKLKVVQTLAEDDDERALEIFDNIGVYLGHSLNLYAMFYDISRVLLLGRVMSGKGGNRILEKARVVLESEYSELARRISLELPDEKSRRVGQSVAAASLPEIINKL